MMASKFGVDKVSLMVCLSVKWQATKCGDVRLTQRLSRVPHHSLKWEPIGHATSTFQIILRARARKSWERLHIHAHTRHKVSLHCSACRLSKLKLRSWESSLKGACLMMNQCHCRYIEHSWVGGHDQSSYLGMFLLCLTSSVFTSYEDQTCSLIPYCLSMTNSHNTMFFWSLSFVSLHPYSTISSILRIEYPLQW